MTLFVPQFQRNAIVTMLEAAGLEPRNRMHGIKGVSGQEHLVGLDQSATFAYISNWRGTGRDDAELSELLKMAAERGMMCIRLDDDWARARALRGRY